MLTNGFHRRGESRTERRVTIRKRAHRAATAPLSMTDMYERSPRRDGHPWWYVSRSRKVLLPTAVLTSVIAVSHGVLFVIGFGTAAVFLLMAQAGMAIVFTAMAITNGASYVRSRRRSDHSG